MADRTYVFRLRGDNGDLVASTDSAAAAIDKLGAKTTELGSKSVAADKQSAAARGALSDQTRRTILQNQQLGYQLNDFFVQVQAGQSPLTAFIQQGSQLSGTFGGMGAAARAVLGLLTPMVVGIGAVAAAAGFLAYGFIKGRQETEAFNKSLLTTGNYAALSAAGLEVMAKKVAESAHVTQGAARESITALAATGEVGPRLIAPLADAMVRVQRASGATAEEISKDFASLAEAPTKFAAEHNKAWNFISGDQYAYIKRLEEQGEKEKAALEVAKLVSAHFSGPLAQSLEKTTDNLTLANEGFANLMNWLRRLGAEETAETRLETINRRIQDLDETARRRRGLVAFSSAPEGRGNETRAGLEDERRAQNMALLRREENALAKAEEERANKAQIAAIDSRDKWREEAKGLTAVNRELERYRKLTVEPLKGTQNEISAAEQAATEAAIREKYKTRGDRAAERLDNRFEERSVALQQEGAKLDAEIKSWELYGRSVDKARVAMLDLEIAQGKLKGLSPARIAELRGLAEADDAKDQALDRAKLNAAVSQSIGVLRSEANAKAENARETEIARRLAEMEARGVKVGTEAYIENAGEIRKWVDVKHDGLLAQKLAAEARSNDAEVARLDAETEALGKSTIERQKSIRVLQLQAEAEADLAANPGQRAQILAELTRKTEQLTGAMQRNYDASRTAEAGFSAAFARYAEDASNSAAVADRALTGGLDRGVDALTKFTQTGKLKLGDLFRFMAEEFTRNWIKMQLVAAATGASSGGGFLGFLSSIAGLFGGGGVNAGTVGGSNVTEAGVPRENFALGGDTGRNRAILVGEHGPEIFFTGSQGGRVLSNSALKGSGRARAANDEIHIHNYGGQVSTERDNEGRLHILFEQMTEKAAQRGAERGHAMVAADLRGGTGRVSAAARSRGVSLGAGPKRN